MDSNQTLLARHKRAVKLQRKTGALLAPHLEKHRLTPMELWVLEVAQQDISMTETAQKLEVTLPQVTALANGLIAKKLIRSKVQKLDRRSRHILATKKGKELYEESLTWEELAEDE